MGLYINGRWLKPGEECEPGCFNHVTHPCETCGRTGGRFPVNYHAQSLSHGGNYAELPEPHIRMFPNDAGVKQGVRVSVNSWIGLDAAARHFYLRFRFDENPVWDYYEGTWRTFWDDKDEFAAWTEEFEYTGLGALFEKLRSRATELEAEGYALYYGMFTRDLDRYIQELSEDWGPSARFTQREGD